MEEVEEKRHVKRIKTCTEARLICYFSRLKIYKLLVKCSYYIQTEFIIIHDYPKCDGNRVFMKKLTLPHFPP